MYTLKRNEPVMNNLQSVKALTTNLISKIMGYTHLCEVYTGKNN